MWWFSKGKRKEIWDEDIQSPTRGAIDVVSSMLVICRGPPCETPPSAVPPLHCRLSQAGAWTHGQDDGQTAGASARRNAKELATKTIEKIIDPAAPPEERAQRRRRLTKGPLEFRDDRVDLYT